MLDYCFSHVKQYLIPIFKGTKVDCRSRITREKHDRADGNAGVKQLLRSDDGTDCVSIQVMLEKSKRHFGCSLHNQYWDIGDDKEVTVHWDT